MLNLLVSLIVMVLILVALDALCAYILGDTTKSNSIVSGFITIFFLYAALMAVIGTGTTNRFISDGVPFVKYLNTDTTLISLFHTHLGLFVIETTELISLLFFISFIEKIIPTNDVNVSMMIISRIILVFVGIILNCYLMSFIYKSVIYKWALISLECILSGGVLVITPIMIIGKLLGVNTNNPALSYAINELPDTEIGRAFSAALSRTAVLILGIMILESLSGPITGILSLGIELMTAIGPLLICCLGLSIMIKSMFK